MKEEKFLKLFSDDDVCVVNVKIDSNKHEKVELSCKKIMKDSIDKEKEYKMVSTDDIFLEEFLLSISMKLYSKDIISLYELDTAYNKYMMINTSDYFVSLTEPKKYNRLSEIKQCIKYKFRCQNLNMFDNMIHSKKIDKFEIDQNDIQVCLLYNENNNMRDITYDISDKSIKQKKEIDIIKQMINKYINTYGDVLNVTKDRLDFDNDVFKTTLNMNNNKIIIKGVELNRLMDDFTNNLENKIDTKKLKLGE